MLCCKTLIENSKQQFWVEWTHNGKLKLWVLHIKYVALDTLMTSVFPLHFTSCYTSTHSHIKKYKKKKKELHKTVGAILKHQGCWMSFINRLLFSPLLGMWWILKRFQVEEGIDYIIITIIIKSAQLEIISLKYCTPRIIELQPRTLHFYSPFCLEFYNCQEYNQSLDNNTL